MEDESDVHDVLGMTVGRILGMFCLDDGLIGFRYPERLQVALNVFRGLFCRVGLTANVAKYKNMNFQAGEIYTGMSEDDFSWRSTEDGDTYRERLRS